jgi:hypothetical protein
LCDYSLQSVKSRAAAVDDKLVTSSFSGTASRGFASVNDPETAICVLPGTEIAFDEPIKVTTSVYVVDSDVREHGHKVARFRQVEVDNKLTHHDAIELPDGTILKLHNLVPGQVATVLQLPAAPKTEEEAKTQERVAVTA